MSGFMIRKTDSGYSFNLTADNNKIVGTSQVYSSKPACLKGIESVESNALHAPVEDQTAKDYTTEPNPKFEIFTDKGDEYRFRLKASNGEIILSSESYTTKENCLKAIDSVKYNTIWSDIREEE